MKVSSFFKILNRKINKYDKLASNPFLNHDKVIIIWVDESNECTCQNEKDKDN